MSVRSITYEVWFKKPEDKTWYIWTGLDDDNSKRANNMKNKFKRMGNKSKVIRVTIMSTVVSR